MIERLATKDLLTLRDITPEALEKLVHLGLKLKHSIPKEEQLHMLSGKKLAMIFEKASTRTRMAFEVGMLELGGQAIFLSTNDMQLGRGESIEDTAKVLSRYVDGVMIRTFKQNDVERFAEAASIPVINGLTDMYHPTQVVADLITILEHKGGARNQSIAYIGDGNNMAHSLMIGCIKMGMHVRCAFSPQYMPNREILDYVQQLANDMGVQLQITHEPKVAVEKADIVVTDTWASMGQEAEKEIRLKAFQGFCVDNALMQLASPQAIFLHCLPAYRGMEVSAEVIDGPQSVVFDEAENRLHAHKAILASLL